MPTGEKQLWSDKTYVGMGVHKVDERGQGVASLLCIRVEQQYIASLGRRDSLIVADGETAIVGVGDEDHVGKLGAEHLDAAISRGVVHDDEFGGDWFCGWLVG